MQLPVMESFYTIQGEGAHTGKAAYFIRLAGCDVGCVWCDVKDSWTVSNDQLKTVETLVHEALQYPSRTVVITGGEPGMYDLTNVIQMLQQSGFRVHIETSGAYLIQGEADWVCVSPKKFKAALPPVLEIADELKVVIYNKSDFLWAEQNAVSVKKECKLYLQPEYEKSEIMMPLIVDYIKAHPQWQISLQTHKFIGIP